MPNLQNTALRLHGLTAQDLVLPTENAAAFETRRAEWHAAYRPVDPAQLLLVDRAVHASWRLDRCAKAEAARLSTRVLHAAADVEQAARDHADKLGEHLLYEPFDRGSQYNVEDPLRAARLEKRDLHNPAILARALASSAAGADWLIARWDDLMESLDTFKSWEQHEVYTACRLLGLRPEEAIDNPVVARIMIAAHAISLDRYGLYDPFARARNGLTGRQIDMRRVESRGALYAPTPEDGLAYLRSTAAREVARLRALKAGRLDDLAEQDQIHATESAHFDDSNAAVLLRRYETACVRELRQSIADVSRLRKEEAKHAAAAPQAVVPTEDPSAIVEAQAGLGSSSQNEPNPAPTTDSQPSRPRFERLVEMQTNGT